MIPQVNVILPYSILADSTQVNNNDVFFPETTSISSNFINDNK